MYWRMVINLVLNFISAGFALFGTFHLLKFGVWGFVVGVFLLLSLILQIVRDIFNTLYDYYVLRHR